jgi:hypothetical protein
MYVPLIKSRLIAATIGISNDPELRREVEGLLSCDGRAGDYVEAVVRSELTAVGFPLAFLIIVFWMASAAAAAWDWCTEQRILS